MVDKTANLTILCVCSLLFILIDFATAWYLMRTKRRMEALPVKGMSARALITGYDKDREGKLDIVTYAFEAADGTKCEGRQILPPHASIDAYPLEGAVDVLYLQKTPDINCLKNHVDTKLGIARNLGIVIKVLPVSAILVIGLLWFCFYRNHLV